MSDIPSALADILAADQIVEPETMADYLAQSLASVFWEDPLPAAVVYPQTEDELAAVVACAHRHQWRLLACGSGSKLGWGGLVKDVDLVISTQRLNQIIDHAVGDMTLTAAAGLKLADLRPVLAAHRQFLALDPAYPDQATLGGIVATGDTGSFRQRFGGVRDMLIGISFVRHDGQIAKAGGRVVKNVAGYDLMKLMTGAYGTLGIISQVTLRLYPLQETSKTMLVSGSADGIRSLAASLRQSTLTPVAVDLMSPELAGQPGQTDNYLLAARFQSIAPGVDEQIDQLLLMVAEVAHTQVLTDSDEADFWTQSTTLLYGNAAPMGTASVMAKFGVRPTEAVSTLEAMAALTSQNYWARVHAASGIGTLRLEANRTTPERLTSLRALCEKAGGYLTILTAPKALKQTLDVWGYNGSALELMRGIKQQFDPHFCLSPGRYFVG